MEPLELEDSKDEGVPLDPAVSRNLPLGVLTKGMKPSVLKRRAQIIIVAFPIIFFAFSCVFSGYQIYMTHTFNKDHPYTVISQILYRLQDLNCNFRMITDIKVIPADEECDHDFRNNEDIGTWNGTVEGCYYPSSGTINLQPCPMANEGYIPPRKPAPLYTWKGNKFCTKVASNYAFMTNYAASAGDAGTKKCSAEPHDFYVHLGENCPISEIQIIPAGQRVPLGYEARKMIDGSTLIFKNDPDSPRRLVDLNSELSTFPCYNPAVSPLRFAHLEPYPLSRKKEEGCGEYGHDQESVVILDKTDPLKLYKENGLEKVQKELPLWNYMHQNEQIVLYAKFRDGLLKMDECNFCRKGFTLDKSAKELTVSGKYMNAYIIVTAVVLIFQFFLIAYNLVKYVEYENNWIGLFNEVIYINGLFYFSNLCYFAVHGMIAYSDYRQLVNATERVRLVEELNCFKAESLNKAFDDLRGKIIDNSKDIMEDCFKAEIIAIFFAAVFILAGYVNKKLIEREKQVSEFQKTKHEQQNIPRAEYASQNVEKAISEHKIPTIDIQEEEPVKKDSPKKDSPKKESPKEEKEEKETTILDI